MGGIKMKILVLSNTPWDNNNSFGNSYSNIFTGMENLEFANIYCRAGNPNNQIPMIFFQISTGAMIKSIFFPNEITTGHVVEKEKCNAEVFTSRQSDLFKHARKMRWVVLLWARELIWRIGKWKSKELLKFLDEFQPDIIFQPIYGQGYSYINRIALFIKDYTGAPMVGYVSDDCYSLRQFSISPLYWIDRIARRGILKKTMQACEILYVISEVQKLEYEKALNVSCKVLTKGIRNTEKFYDLQTIKLPLKLIYAGNIGEGRWKTLSEIGTALDKINTGGVVGEIYLYTTTPMTNKMRKAMNKKSIHLMGSIDSSGLPLLYKNADILVHVESLKFKERLLVHQSFSTKLVDYFEIGKCIFAVGTPDIASIEYLLINNAAIVATCKKDIVQKLNLLLCDSDLIIEYGRNAFDCGINNHLIMNIQKMLYHDFKLIVSNIERTESID